MIRGTRKPAITIEEIFPERCAREMLPREREREREFTTH